MEVLVFVLGRIGAFEIRRDRHELCVDQVCRRASRQSCGQYQGLIAAIAERQIRRRPSLGQRFKDAGWRPQLRAEQRRRPREALPCHANHGERACVDGDLGPHHVRRAAKALPQIVTQDRDGDVRARSFFLTREIPAQRQRRPERVEESARDDARERTPDHVAFLETRQTECLSAQRRKETRPIAQVGERRIRHGAVAVRALEVAAVEAHDLAVRMALARLQQQRVDQAEDGGRRPDAQGQHERRHESETGGFRQHSRAKPKVMKKRVHELSCGSSRERSPIARKASLAQTVCRDVLKRAKREKSGAQASVPHAVQTQPLDEGRRYFGAEPLPERVGIQADGRPDTPLGQTCLARHLTGPGLRPGPRLGRLRGPRRPAPLPRGPRRARPARYAVGKQVRSSRFGPHNGLTSPFRKETSAPSAVDEARQSACLRLGHPTPKRGQPELAAPFVLVRGTE